MRTGSFAAGKCHVKKKKEKCLGLSKPLASQQICSKIWGGGTKQVKY